MNALLLAGLALGLVLLVLAMRRRAAGSAAALVGLGYVGSALTLVGLLAQPWAVPAPSDVFERNVHWLAQRPSLLHSLQKAPVFGQALASLDLSSADALRASLERSAAGLLVRQATTGQPLRSWHLWQVGWQLSPALSLGLTAAFLGSLVSAGLVIVVLFTGAAPSSRLGLAVGVAAGLSLLLLATRATTLDSLGSSDHLVVRLTAALAQVSVGPGVWWTLLGLLFLVAFGVACAAAGRSGANSEPLSEYEEGAVLLGGWT